jgi:DNA-directed RNA polymerase specialized sigma24 family protein
MFDPDKVLSPEDAWDILTCPYRFEYYYRDCGLEPRAARRVLREMAAPALAVDAPEMDPEIVRVARKTQALRGNLGGRRKDVESLARFVDRVVGLSNRLREVFHYCFVQGMSHRECAARLGISPNTVRRHLHRLREMARRCGGGPPEKTDRVW